MAVDADAKEAKPVEKKAPAKPKKAPAKPLSQMMEEDVIPSLKAILEAQDDITQLELSFKENRVSIPSFFLPKMPLTTQNGSSLLPAILFLLLIY